MEVDLRDRHALIGAEIVQGSFNDVIASLQDYDADEALLLELARKIYETLAGIASQLPTTLPKEDQRLSHIVVYLMACMELPKEFIIDYFIIDQIRRLGKHYPGRMKELAKVAIHHTSESSQLFCEETCKVLHVQYESFRRAARLFLEGAKFFHDDKHDLALPWLQEACHTNESLLELCNSHKLGLVKNTMAAIDTGLVAYYRRLCLLHLNDMVSHWFTTDYKKTAMAVAVVQKAIVPGVGDLLASRMTADRSAAAEIREKWSNLATDESMPEPKRLQLQGLLEALLEATAVDAKRHSSQRHLSIGQLGASLKTDYQRVIAAAGWNLQAAAGSEGICSE